MMSRLGIGKLWICFFISILGCETVVDVKIPQHNPQLVVNSFFAPDSVWRAHVSQSIPSNSDSHLSEFLVDDALVIIKRGEVVIDTLKGQGEGWYQSEGNHRPAESVSYFLQASVPGDNLPLIEAVASTPSKVDFTNAEIEDLGYGNGSRFARLLRLNFSFKDPSGQDHYRFDLLTGITGSAEPDYRFARFESSESSFYPDYNEVGLTTDGLTGSSYFGSVIIDDRRFDGEELSTSITFNVVSERGQQHAFRLILYRLSFEYFKYHETLATQRTDISGLYYEPNQIYSNIDGGYGIFAGYSPAIYDILWTQIED